MKNYVADGRVINVRDWLEEQIGVCLYTQRIPSDAFDIETWLMLDGEVIAEEDSAVEVCVGGPAMTKDQVQTVLDNILDDINKRGVDPHCWFTF
jgi:hypothetical protein